MTNDEQVELPSISIESELKKSYLDYAMSVIIGRALPDVRDGLKPVHRRALFAMRELSNYHNRPYLKSARIVGDIIGKYHPHGDQAAYDTIVRMAQDFSMRYRLVDGQGNFGSVDGDSAAAMRYTEARMTKLDQEIIGDLDQDTVEFAPTYDNSMEEPTVLPTKVPTLLMNGSSGIAVGMATNIPPHNLTEVMNGLIAMVDDPNITVNQLMDHVTGPDFPTGAFICGRAGIREAYETGRGSVLMRSKTHVEKSKKKNRESVIITEIPYMQNKVKLIEKIILLVKDKRVTSIAEIRDESDRHGMRIVLDLKKDEIADVVINQLYKMTPLQRSFGVNMLAIVNNKPEVLNLKQIMEHFVLHRKTVVYRRTAFKLRKAEEKAHILLGLKVALDNLDEIVELIKKSANPKEAKENLIVRFELSDIQAQSILDMRLQKLTGLEQEKIINELSDLLQKIERFKEILADDLEVMKIIRTEFEEIREQYGDDRLTEIIEAPDEILPEDMIQQQDMVVTVTHEGYIKRNPVDLYRSQRRGGKGVKGINANETDFVSSLYLASVVNIAKEDLLSGLASLQNISSKKGTIAILSNVLIQTGNDCVELTCTDLEIGLRCKLPAEILSEGSITLPCKKLFEIVREAECSHIHIEEKENSWVKVSVETGNYNIAGMENDEFPNFPEYDESKLVSISASKIQELIEKTIFSMASDGESQFSLVGVLVEKIKKDDESMLRFVSSDGHRLSLMQEHIGAELDSLTIDSNTLIPKKGVQEIKKFCEGMDEIYFSFEEKQAVLKKDTAILIIRLLNGEFPDYLSLVNMINRDKFIEVEKISLINAFRRMNLFAEDKFNIVQFSLSSGKITLSSQSMDIGNAREEIEVAYEGEEIKMGFNGKYFIETLSVMKSDNVKIYVSSNESPCMILSEKDPEYISIIMPMHL